MTVLFFIVGLIYGDTFNYLGGANIVTIFSNGAIACKIVERRKYVTAIPHGIDLVIEIVPLENFSSFNLRTML